LRADITKAFNAMKEHLSLEVPELGTIITHWEDPFLVPKNRTIMLPDSHSGTNDRLAFTVILWASTVEKTADAIAQTQMAVMEKIFRAVHGNIPQPLISAAVNSADYFDPAPQSPTVGVLRVFIEMTVDFIDDCGM